LHKKAAAFPRIPPSVRQKADEKVPDFRRAPAGHVQRD
jgi:hypothetical protein